MLHRKHKRLISLVLVFLLVAGTVIPASASGIAAAGDSTVFSVATLNAYAQENMALYATVKGLDITDGSFEMSQGIPVSNSTADHKHMYFLFEDDVCVARMTVAYVDGQFTSSFCLSELPEITAAYVEGSEIALFAHDSKLLASIDGRIVSMSGDDCTAEVVHSASKIVLAYENIGTALLSADMLPAQYSANAVRTGYAHVLDVPLVANAVSPDNNRGLCWAACVSSIGAYVTNTTPMTALDLYRWLDANHFVLFEPYPIGNRSYVRAGFRKFGLDTLIYNSGFPFSEISGSIDDDLPVYIVMTNDASDLSPHALVICGYQTAPGGYHFYELMDPNVSNDTVTVLVSSVGTNFTYSPEGFTDSYTTWRDTYFVR